MPADPAAGPSGTAAAAGRASEAGSASLGAAPHDAIAALADLAFAVSTPAPTLRHGSDGQPLEGGHNAWPADPMDLDLDDPLQRDFGDYELRSRLGQGGMGVVYRAHQRSLAREVAIKLLAAGPWASRGFLQRFRSEAQSAARMQHPNIVTIHEIGEHEGLPFFSMRLVEGRSLAEQVQREGPLPPRAAAACLRTVAEAVDYAHRLGVLHLDLKPANVLIEAGGEPVVADFGLARRLEEGLAGTEDVSGTPSYMAPEQVLGAPLQASTDVYGLGATLYEALTGMPPFRGATARQTMERLLHESPLPPRELQAAVPADLQAICLRCLARDPAQRYPSARALAEDLGRFLEGREVQARPLQWWQRGWRLLRREPRLSALALLLLCSLSAGLLATTVQRQRADAHAAEALSRLWQSRSLMAEAALDAGDGFRALPAMLDNLQEMRASGAVERAGSEARRLAVLLANAPQPLRQWRLEGDRSVSALALSPDGSRLAVAHHDGRGGREFHQYRVADGVLEWSARNPGRQLLPFRHIPHGYMRYTADGRFLLTTLLQQPVLAAPHQHDMLAFDSSDGRLLQPPDPDGRVSDVLYSADASLALVRYRSAASLRFPDSVRLYRSADWQPLSAEQPHAAVQWHFTPAGDAVLASSDGLAWQLLDLPELRPRWSLQLPAADLLTAWMPSAKFGRMLLGCQSGRVAMLDLASGTLQDLPSPPTAPVRWIAVDDGGGRVAAYAENGQLQVWTLPGGEPAINPLRAAATSVRTQLRLAGDLLLLPEEHELRVWTLPRTAPFGNEAVPAAVRLASSLPMWPNAFDFHAASGRLALGDRAGGIALWQVGTPGQPRLRGAPWSTQALHYDGRQLLQVADGQLRLHGSQTHWRIDHPQPVRLAELSAQGRWLLSLAGRSLRVFDPADGRQQGETLVLPDTPVRALLAESAQAVLFSTLQHAGEEAQERLWLLDLDRVQWRALEQATLPLARKLLLDPQARFVVRNGHDGSLQLQPLAGADRLCPALLPPGARMQALAISADGRHLWTAEPQPADQERIQAWDLQHCAEALSVTLPTIRRELAARVTADGLILQGLTLTGVWHLRLDGSHRAVEGMVAADSMHALAVSADGRLLAQAARNAVQLFDLERGERISGRLVAPIAGNDAITRLSFAVDQGSLLAQSLHGDWLRWSLGDPAADPQVLAAEVALRLPGASARLAPGERWGAETPLAPASAEPAPLVHRLADPAAAAPDPAQQPLDLRAAIDAPWDGSWPLRPEMGGDALSLGRGLHRLLGVDLWVQGGVQLSGGRQATVLHPQRERTDWITLEPLAASRVHLLLFQHVPMQPDEPPSVALRVWLRDRDGRVWPLQVWRGTQLYTHYLDRDPRPAGPRIGWAGSFPAQTRAGSDSRQLISASYLASVDIPAAAAPITAIAFGIGDGNMEAPLIHAVSLQRRSQAAR